MKRGLTVICAAICLAANLCLAAPLTYDVAADFSATNNPNGVWSYGWSSTLTSAFNLYLNHGIFDDAIPVDVWAGSNFPYSPNVSHNGTENPITHPTIIWQPGQFSLHPGDSGEYSYARWTAPNAGTFDIDAMFTGIDRTTTDVHVLHNGISLFDGLVNGLDNTSSFSTTVRVGRSDIIDFAVGYGVNQSHTSDTTSRPVAAAKSSTGRLTAEARNPKSSAGHLTVETNSNDQNSKFKQIAKIITQTDRFS